MIIPTSAKGVAPGNGAGTDRYIVPRGPEGGYTDDASFLERL